MKPKPQAFLEKVNLEFEQWLEREGLLDSPRQTFDRAKAAGIANEPTDTPRSANLGRSRDTR